LSELRLYERCESVKALAHIGSTGCEPHLHPRRQCNHRRTNTPITRLRAFASTAPCTRTRCPFESSISMTPPVRSLRARLAVLPPSCIGTTVGVPTFTGNIGGFPCAALGSSNPRRDSCLQANTWLGLTL